MNRELIVQFVTFVGIGGYVKHGSVVEWNAEMATVFVANQDPLLSSDPVDPVHLRRKVNSVIAQLDSAERYG